MTLNPPETLPEDIAEIAASIPTQTRTLGVLRQIMALLPEPAGASTQGSFPADELVPPQDAASQMGTTPGPGSIGPGGISDGAIGSGQLRDGAVTGAAFAATIAPVHLVSGLPALPDPAYPVDHFAYDILAVPKRLYKNVANVWVAAVGPDDIQANSITAGQIAAGAIATSELAVGARLTGEFANEAGATPGVFADATGLLIRSGKLVLQDEFGHTVMVASGFEGTWADFLAMGLYNAVFGVGNTGTLALGRTSDLPFWTVARDDDGAVRTYDGGGTAFLSRVVDAGFPSGFRVQMQWTALGQNAYLISDPVRIVAGYAYPMSAYIEIAHTAGTIKVESNIRWLDATGAIIGDDPIQVRSFSADLLPTWVDIGTTEPGTVIMPPNAQFAQVILRGYEETTHSAFNRLEVGAITWGPGISPNAFFRVGDIDADDLFLWDALTVLGLSQLDSLIVSPGSISIGTFETPMRHSKFAQKITDQGPFTALTDLTGLSVTMDVPAGHRIRITGAAHMESTVADDSVSLHIREGGTQLTEELRCLRVAGRPDGVVVVTALTPTAGNHTYKISAERQAGTGNITVKAAGTREAFILVEDLGEA